MPKLPPKGALTAAALALTAALAVAIAACTSAVPAPPTRAPSLTGFVISTQLPNGAVEITIATSYPLGRTATIPITISATRGSVAGPVTARVLASGIGDANVRSEVLVRDLPVTPVTVAANGRASTALSWDTRDAKGTVVPADAYSLVLEVRSEDAGAIRTFTATATLDVR